MYDTLDPYRLRPEIAPSDIRLYLDSPSKYKRIKIDQILTASDRATTRAMERGNAYDDFFCSPATFRDKYQIIEAKAPGEKLGNILEELYEYSLEYICNPDPTSLNYTGIALADLDLTYKPLQEVIERLVVEHEYQSSWKLETRVNDVIKKGDEYFRAMLSANGKTPISLWQYSKIKSDIERLEEDPVMGKFIKLLRSDVEIPGVEKRFQVETVYDRIKGKKDIVIINHKQKRAYAIDLKTGATRNQFAINYFVHKYYLQGSMYRELVRSMVPEDYEVLPTQFLVIYTQAELNPERIPMSEAHDLAARIGGVMGQWGEVEGWENIVEEIHWQQSLPEEQQFHCRQDSFEQTLTMDYFSKTILIPEVYKK